jgi:hypothetical protein
MKLIEAVNRAFTVHGLQPFHEVPLPHVSLAWTLGDDVAALQQQLDRLQQRRDDGSSGAVTAAAVKMQVTEVQVQMGHTKHVVWQGW